MCRVALIGENSIGYVDTLLDIWNNGDCAVLLDWRIPFQTLKEMMKEADVHKCFIERCLFDKLGNNITNDVSFFTFLINCLSEAIMPKFSLPDGITII